MTATPPPYPNAYPPNPYAAPQPPADPAALFRLLAALLAVLAAGLIVVGSFLPHTTYAQLSDGKTVAGQSQNAWTRTFDVEPDAQSKQFYDNTHVARYGIPLSAGALMLLVGAGLVIAGSRRGGSDRMRSAGRTALLAGAAGTASAVWMLGMDVSATLSYEQHDAAAQTEYGTGLGFWLLIGGAVVALAVLLFAILAGRKPPIPQQFAPYQPGPPFPPGGYGEPPSQPFAAQPPPSQPFPAQPYPGRPPVSQPFPAQSPPHLAQPRDQLPTEPNYQLPPLDPPNT